MSASPARGSYGNELEARFDQERTAVEGRTPPELREQEIDKRLRVNTT